MRRKCSSDGGRGRARRREVGDDGSSGETKRSRVPGCVEQHGEEFTEQSAACQAAGLQHTGERSGSAGQSTACQSLELQCVSQWSASHSEVSQRGSGKRKVRAGGEWGQDGSDGDVEHAHKRGRCEACDMEVDVVIEPWRDK